MRVYVAGLYSSNEDGTTDVLGVLKNIGRGEKWCADLFMAGFSPFCPWHDKSYVITHFDKDFTVEQFYKFSLDWLEVSDAIFLIPNINYTNSVGVTKEIERARKLGIPIFQTIEGLKEWEEVR